MPWLRISDAELPAPAAFFWRLGELLQAALCNQTQLGEPLLLEPLCWANTLHRNTDKTNVIKCNCWTETYIQIMCYGVQCCIHHRSEDHNTVLIFHIFISKCQCSLIYTLKQNNFNHIIMLLWLWKHWNEGVKKLTRTISRFYTIWSFHWGTFKTYFYNYKVMIDDSLLTSQCVHKIN